MDGSFIKATSSFSKIKHFIHMEYDMACKRHNVLPICSKMFKTRL